MKYYKLLELEDLPNEIWADALGFDGIYEVSNLGRIKSLGRYVNGKNGQRWNKERIRKQFLSKDGRLGCIFCHDGNKYSQNIQALIYLSFNIKNEYNIKTNCVMHLDKNKSNNTLSNLKIESISYSHEINYEKKLLPHLKANNDKRRNDYLKLTHKACVECGNNKKISDFEYGRNKCIDCRKEEKKEHYRNNKH